MKSKLQGNKKFFKKKGGKNVQKKYSGRISLYG
jgi:hypothetical protein